MCSDDMCRNIKKCMCVPGMHTDDVTYDFDESGYGIKSFKKVEMAAMDSPTTCKMKRP